MKIMMLITIILIKSLLLSTAKNNGLSSEDRRPRRRLQKPTRINKFVAMETTRAHRNEEDFRDIDNCYRI